MSYSKQKQITIGNSMERLNISLDDIGKIMYYLNRVCHCIDFNDLNKYTNYFNYSSLSHEDQQFIFSLALCLSPDLFIGKIFFPDGKLSDHGKEKFCQISCSSILPSPVIINGETYQTKRIFIFHEKWLNEYYLDPMNKLAQQFRCQQRSRKFCLVT
ncbi:unnamed protein product [Adineta steineri]|uniref:Uncharacterized protein n=1 Tax=Adineta steineri TaxID=433720 RepID=A0A819GF81_9BILA|nr:unnamed protein product [Adineta steineri]CAF3880976.1 unnamed protein product [Adineta steineri]